MRTKETSFAYLGMIKNSLERIKRMITLSMQTYYEHWWHWKTCRASEPSSKMCVKCATSWEGYYKCRNKIFKESICSSNLCQALHKNTRMLQFILKAYTIVETFILIISYLYIIDPDEAQLLFDLTALAVLLVWQIEWLSLTQWCWSN